MRNMSFALTTAQILAKQKTVTRRIGWRFLKPGDLVQPVKKCMGLKAGEKIEKIGGPIRIERVDGEWMSDFCHAYTRDECAREGFPEMSPVEFYNFFRGISPNPSGDDVRVNRIEFSYVEGANP